MLAIKDCHSTAWSTWFDSRVSKSWLRWTCVEGTIYWKLKWRHPDNLWLTFEIRRSVRYQKVFSINATWTIIYGCILLWSKHSVSSHDNQGSERACCSLQVVGAEGLSQGSGGTNSVESLWGGWSSRTVSTTERSVPTATNNLTKYRQSLLPSTPVWARVFDVSTSLTQVVHADDDVRSMDRYLEHVADHSREVRSSVASARESSVYDWATRL